MKTKVLIFFVISLSILLLSCSKDSTGPDNEVIATELWNVTIDNGAGSGTWQFNLLPDSTDGLPFFRPLSMC